MAKQDGPFADALRSCRAYIILIDLVEKKCPIQTDRRTQTADNADDSREHDKFPRLYAAMVAGQREDFQEFPQYKLSGDDIDQIHNAHHQHTEERAPAINIGAAEIGNSKGQVDGHEQRTEESNSGQQQRRRSTSANTFPDVFAVGIRLAKAQQE